MPEALVLNEDSPNNKHHWDVTPTVEVEFICHKCGNVGWRPDQDCPYTDEHDA